MRFMFFFLCACSAPDFNKFSQLGELRMLGIVADKPEIDGTRSDAVQVTLTPYLSDIDAGGREFTVMVGSCLDPGLSQGASPRCLQPKLATYPSGNTFDTSVLRDKNYTGAMTAITITIDNPASLIAARDKQQQYNGVNYLVIFNLRAGDAQLTAVKAIAISARENLNTNPEIDKIYPACSSLTDHSEMAISFTATGKQQDYREMRADGSFNNLTESYFITWFYLHGKVRPSRILLNQPSTYIAGSEDQETLVAVVKDRRGGTAVQTVCPH